MVDDDKFGNIIDLLEEERQEREQGDEEIKSYSIKGYQVGGDVTEED
jgi:hypothetical protein